MSKFTLALLLIVAAGEAVAAAARVDFAYGNVTVSGLDGREQPLVRGAELDNGDTVRTADGRAQLRFRDGAYVSLQPNSEFAIRDYRFDGKTDGAERGFFGLAKGAMRTVTGLIGRVNRDRYQVITPTATIGIRGTGGVIQVLNDGSTLIVGTSGIWSLTNPAGSIDVPAGVSGLAPVTPDAPPQQTSQAPRAGPAPLPLPKDQPFRQGEQLQADGTPQWLALATRDTPVLQPPPPQPAPQPLTSGSGYAAALAYGLLDLDFAGIIDRSTAVAGVFNSSGQLTEANLAGTLYRFDGAHADFGTDGILAWGRWTGQVSIGAVVQSYDNNQGLHYVIGMPTPVLPTQGVATYTLLGATRPTYLDGSATPGTFAGSLNVNFGSLTVGLNLNMAMGDGRGYAIGGSAQISGSTFSGSGGQGGAGLLTTSGSGGACLSGCLASVQGFFSGTSAERAGLGYHIVDDKQLIGAAAFKKQ
jgi:hypothetical protein